MKTFCQKKTKTEKHDLPVGDRLMTPRSSSRIFFVANLTAAKASMEGGRDCARTANAPLVDMKRGEGDTPCWLQECVVVSFNCVAKARPKRLPTRVFILLIKRWSKKRNYLTKGRKTKWKMWHWCGKRKKRNAKHITTAVCRILHLNSDIVLWWKKPNDHTMKMQNDSAFLDRRWLFSTQTKNTLARNG